MSVMPPWSYTALSTFETCPRQYYHRYILKEKSPETEATRHGTEVHAALEKRVRDGTPLPMAYSQWEPLAASVALKGTELGKKITVEYELALDDKLRKTGFLSPNVWGRGKADVVIVNGQKGHAWVGDWKTGKTREKKAQVQIFAGFLFKLLPSLTKVTANNIWLNANKIGMTYTFTRAGHENQIWDEIMEKIIDVELACERETFDPKPSGLCGFCEVKTCPHQRKR